MARTCSCVYVYNVNNNKKYVNKMVCTAVDDGFGVADDVS